MKIFVKICLFSFFIVSSLSSSALAESIQEKFKIEGILSIASIKVLQTELPKKIDVKIVDLNLKKSDSGWPELELQYDTNSVRKEDIEKMIGEIEDPAGHKYKVHKGPLLTNAALLEEEMAAMSVMGDTAVGVNQVKNPTVDFDESIKLGEVIYKKNCAKCHGLNGNGNGVVSHGFTNWPKQLWVWYGADSAADGYLHWILENGKADMPPWGLVFSEKQRWDVINYIKTLKNPEGA